MRGTLKHWVDQYGAGKKTALDGPTTTRPASPSSGWQSPAGPQTLEAKIARLEAENAALRAETTKLTAEREILQRAAKYFAGETRW